MTHTLTDSLTGESPDIRPQLDTESKLRFILRANATTSALGGLAMAVAPGAADQLLGTGQPEWVRVVGLSLLPFAALVAWLSTADRRRLSLHTPGIVVGDVGWVVASAVTILLGWYSASGTIVVLAMAAAVDTFAVLQFVLLRRLSR